MVTVNLRAAAGTGIGIIAAAMIIFMLGQPRMYPLWTVIMIGAVGALAFLTVFRAITDT